MMIHTNWRAEDGKGRRARLQQRRVGKPAPRGARVTSGGAPHMGVNALLPPALRFQRLARVRMMKRFVRDEERSLLIAILIA